MQRDKPVSLIHTALLSARFKQGCVFPFSSLHTHNSPLYNYQHENVSDEIAGRQLLMLQTEREYSSFLPCLPSDFLSSGALWDLICSCCLFLRNVCIVITKKDQKFSCCVTLVITHVGSDKCCGCLIYLQTHISSFLLPLCLFLHSSSLS